MYWQIMGLYNFKDIAEKSRRNKNLEKPALCCHCCDQKASFFVSSVSAHGKVTSVAFCVGHAFKAGLLHPKKWGLLEQNGRELHKPTELVCRCGLTQARLRIIGRVGCAHCYTTFAALLKPALPELHNATAHAGKSPAKFAPRVDVRRRVMALEMAMQRAIKREAYEQAAVFRDELKELVKI
jgi:protein arginine kinase activator